MSTEKVLKNSLIFLITDFFLKTAGFLLMPIYTRKISPDEFGTIYLLTTFSNLYVTIVSFRIDSSISRFYYSCQEKQEIKILYSSILNFITIVYGVSFLIVIIFREILENFLQVKFFPYIFIVLLSSFFGIIYMIAYSLLIVEENAKMISIYSIISSLSGIFFTIIFVFNMNDKILAYILGSFIASFIQLSLSIMLTKKYYIFKISINIKNYFKYSFSRIVFELGSWIVTFSDRIILSKYHGIGSNGIYSIGYRFGQIIEIFTNATSRAYIPSCYKSFENSKKESKDFIKKYASYLFALYFALAFILICFSNELMSILGKGYRESKSVFILITMTYLIGGLVYIFQPIMDYKIEFIKFKQIIWGFVALINLCLNFLLIPKYSYNGAALATLISYFFMLIMIFLISIKYGKQNYEIIKMLKIFLISILYALVLILELSIINFLLKFILSIVYLIIMIKILNINLKELISKFRRKV